MYSSFVAEGFRGFRRLKVDGLQRVNLIAGANGVGKTALLEALFLHCGGFNPALVVTVAATRGISAYKIESDAAVEPPWSSLFLEFDESRKVTLTGTFPTLEGEPLQLRQLLQNLVGNALKFHKPQTPPQVTVEGQVLPAEDGGSAPPQPERLRLTVTDNGIGFDVERRRRSGTSTTGLLIMEERATELGGRLSILSFVRGGTRVMAKIPLS